MRSSPRRSFRLTEERKALLNYLIDFRYLRTSHVYMLCITSRRVSQRAVRRLLHDFYEHGFLRRQMLASGIGRQPLPKYEYVYWLSPAGQRLARDCGVSDGDEARARNLVQNLEHDTAISDFHLAVARFACREQWQLFWLQRGLKRGMNPDALFALTDPDAPAGANTTYYFLEVERSGPSGYRGGRSIFLQRLHRYAEYQGTTVCRRDWEWFDEFRVVVVLPSEARRRNLLARLSIELPLPMFWLAVEEADFDGAVFLTPADGGRAHSLRD